MSTIKRIVCLANSRKSGGRCVAGKVYTDHPPSEWVRPVSTESERQLYTSQTKCVDYTYPQLLDVIDIPLSHHVPHGCQTENWAVVPGQRWEKVLHIEAKGLKAYADSPETLWVNRSQTRHGCNDRVAVGDAKSLNCSLYLIRVPQLSLRVLSPSGDPRDPERRVQATFTYLATEYSLKVTDPVVEFRFRRLQRTSEEQVGDSYLTISLGEEWGGFHYKLVAAVIQPDRTPEQ